MSRTLRHRLVVLLALLPAVLAAAGAQERTRVLVVTSGARAVDTELIDAARAQLATNGGNVELKVVELSELDAGEAATAPSPMSARTNEASRASDSARGPADVRDARMPRRPGTAGSGLDPIGDDAGARPNLIVAVGTRASQQLATLGGDTPVLSVLTPRVSFDEIAREWRNRRAGNGGAPLSAIYLDQSPQRHFALIRELFPQARRVAIMLGPATAAYAGELRAAARDHGLVPLIGSITAEQNLIHALDALLPQADVMLAVVDPLVFNRTNAPRVLLTAYRHRVPLVGVSPAYVRAGAIAAVHATPAQIGQQLGDLLASFARTGSRQLPAPQYPKQLAVTVNEQVARSLELPLPDNRRLEQRLLGRGGSP